MLALKMSAWRAAWYFSKASRPPSHPPMTWMKSTFGVTKSASACMSCLFHASSHALPSRRIAASSSSLIILGQILRARSKRIGADDFPVVMPEEFVGFVPVGRAAFQERLDVAAGGGRGVESQEATGFA